MNQSDQTQQTAVLDQAPLDELVKVFGEGGIAIVEEIVKTYLEESPDLVSRLNGGASTRNLVAIRDAAHTLKSASVNVGAFALSTRCQSVEREARTGDPDLAIGGCKGIDDLFQETATALSHWLETSCNKSAGG